MRPVEGAACGGIAGAVFSEHRSIAVLDRDRGLIERIGDATGDNPTDDSELYALAEDQLAAAAADSDLRERAETNTRAMLTGLAQSLGVDEVEIRFEETADSNG